MRSEKDTELEREAAEKVEARVEAEEQAREAAEEKHAAAEKAPEVSEKKHEPAKPAHSPAKKGLMERRKSFLQSSVPNAHRGYNPKTPVVMMCIIAFLVVLSVIFAAITS